MTLLSEKVLILIIGTFLKKTLVECNKNSGGSIFNLWHALEVFWSSKADHLLTLISNSFIDNNTAKSVIEKRCPKSPVLEISDFFLDLGEKSMYIYSSMNEYHASLLKSIKSVILSRHRFDLYQHS